MKTPNNNLTDDRSLDAKLRPNTWNKYRGQHDIKKALRILIDAAKKRGEPIEHILLHGPSGLGKTTLAYLVANEIGANIKITSGPAIEKVGDLAAILTNLTPNDILFIDEAHRLNKLIEEVLYPAMENGTLDIIIGKGPSARTIQLELPPFTLIAATTRMALLSAPLRSRFSGGAFRLNFYTADDIHEIVNQSAEVLGAAIEKEAIQEIVKRSRATPRIANRLLKRCRDLAQVKELATITPACAHETFSLLNIDDVGLEPIDRHILKLIIEKFGGGPVGLQTVAASLQEASDTIEEVYEPYLLQLGFLQRTPRGRAATEAAYLHLGLRPPKKSQDTLI